MNINIAPLLCSLHQATVSWKHDSVRQTAVTICMTTCRKRLEGCWWISVAWPPVFTRRVNNRLHIHLTTHECEVHREWGKYSRQTTARHSSVCLTGSQVIFLTVLLSVILSNYSIKKYKAINYRKQNPLRETVSCSTIQ